MDWLTLIQNAAIQDQYGNYVGPVLGFKVMGNKMVINTVIDYADIDDDDPDDGEKEPIPEPVVVPIRAVGGTDG